MADRRPDPRGASIVEAAREEWQRRFERVRRRTEVLASHLVPEDMVLQPMPDASPTKWHLAHTTWFFEEFLLRPHELGFVPYHEQYGFLFNSYYEAVGDRWQRPDRGLLSRPTVSEVFAYRSNVNERVSHLLSCTSEEVFAAFEPVLEIGLHHEEQHQELLCTDIKYALSLNPLAPSAFPIPDNFSEPTSTAAAANERWIGFPGGLYEIGHEGKGFSFDNEGPRHRVYLEPFELHGTPVTNGQFLDFIEDGVYRAASLWLSDGWAWIQSEDITAPLYWRKRDDEWFEYTLHGEIPLRRDRILSHVSAYEAFAYASWAQARLPYEAELEWALTRQSPSQGQFLDPHGFVHPHLVGRDQGLGSAYGTVWDWTQSAYTGYPGYKAPPGAIGEYNGKFMSSQLVLKGGSVATPPGHIRATYRNFFPPDARWQFTGIRLARDV